MWAAIRNRLTIMVPYIWLLIFFLLPFILVFRIALSDLEFGQPPYAPQWDTAEGLGGLWAMVRQWDFENFTFLFGDTLYIKSYLSSLRIAFFSTIFALLVGFPLAYGMARAPLGLRPILLMLVILPFWTSFLIRVYAWIGILKQDGLLNQFLMWLGLIEEPLIILSTNTAVYIGIVYSYLPFMVLPIYATLERMDESLVEAARDLGCTAIGAFWKVTAPLAIPGVLAGCMLVFIPAVGEFVIPDLLGGSETLMIGKTLWVEFFNNSDWPVASAIATILLIVLVVPIVWFQNVQAKTTEARK